MARREKLTVVFFGTPALLRDDVRVFGLARTSGRVMAIARR